MKKQINILGINFDVEYDYEPYEPAQKDKYGRIIQPETYEDLKIVSIEHKGTDFEDFFLELDMVEEIENLIMEE